MPGLDLLRARRIREHGASGKVERLVVEDVRTRQIEIIDVEAVLIRVGMAPNTEMFRGQVELDDEGYVKVDQRQRTSVESIYAAGDVCRPVCLSVATAVGH
ncbi:MAG: NAD(P)/FAD-dependent oxidoreductase [Blastocatellia bacterium]